MAKQQEDTGPWVDEDAGPRVDDEIHGTPKSDVPRDHRGRWLTGVSGNPAGRAPGTRSRLNQMADAMVGEPAPDIMRKVIERALEGDATCLQLSMARISPAIKGSTMALPGLPPLDSIEHCDTALGAVIEAGATGKISTDQCSLLVEWLRIKQQSLEARELAERVRALESRPPIDIEPGDEYEYKVPSLESGRPMAPRHLPSASATRPTTQT